MGLYRIIEIEWAVKHNKDFVPSPKRQKKTKSKKKGKGVPGSGLKVELVEPIIPMADVKMEVEDWQDEADRDVKRSAVKQTNKGKRKNAARFGSEATNRLDEAEADESMETSLKRQRLGQDTRNEDYSPAKETKRKVVAVTQ